MQLVHGRPRFAGDIEIMWVCMSVSMAKQLSSYCFYRAL